MPTPAVPILTLCDQLVTELTASWAPQSPDSIRRDYDQPVIPKDIAGRQVVIFPAAYHLGSGTRGKDKYAHRVSVLTVERYVDAGIPLVTWADDRVEFVYTKIVRGFDYARKGKLEFSGREIFTEEINDVEVYDVDMLVGQRLFWSEVALVFGEFY